MAKKKFRVSIFYIIYFLLVIAALTTIFFAAKQLWTVLDDYEGSLSKYVAEDVFEKYYSPCDFALLGEMAGIQTSPYEDLGDFAEYMENKAGGRDITYYEVSAGLGETKKFVVKAGDEKISDFTLKKSNKTSRFGFELWELDSISLVYEAKEDIVFSHIKGGTLKLNGRDIDLSACTVIEDNIPTFSELHMLEGSGASPITYATYKIDGLFLEPELEAFERNGNASVLTYDAERDIYKEEITYDEKLREERLTVTTEAAEVYLRFMTRDAYLYTLGLYFDKTSDIYRKVSTSDTQWFAYHIGYEFKDAKMDEFYAYSDDTFSCRYTCTHTINLSASDTYEFPTDITFYFRIVGDDTLVYDLVSNN